MGRILAFIPFVLLLYYWGYLVVATEPMLIYDAIGYQDLGRLLLERGWWAYFHGFYREPLFPYLISLAMRLEQVTGYGYQYILKIFLLVELALAMAGTYRLARLLGARRLWAGLAAFYLGISPVILNSTLWLWSEAATYPFVVWGVVWMIRTWKEMGDLRDSHRLAWHAGITTLFFIFAAMVKAPIATVFIVMLVPFAVCVFYSLWRNDGRTSYRALMVVLICSLMMGAYVENYKFLNWIGNGNHAITNRADIALFGNTVRRLDPEALKRIPQALLSVPRLGLCERYYGRSCGYWSYATSDNINAWYIKELTDRGASYQQQQEYFFATSFRLMREHPFQQMFFSLVEGLKMFFWENRLWFVKYPAWMVKIYSNNVLVYTLCFSMMVLSLAGLLCAIYRAIRYGRIEHCFAALFVCAFTAAYMVFFVDIRYGFPLAPVFLALIAAIGACIEKKKES